MVTAPELEVMVSVPVHAAALVTPRMTEKDPVVVAALTPLGVSVSSSTPEAVTPRIVMAFAAVLSLAEEEVMEIVEDEVGCAETGERPQNENRWESRSVFHLTPLGDKWRALTSRT